MSRDTIFALSSGRPPAALAVIRVSGPGAAEAGRRLAGALPAPRRVALRELRDPRSGGLIDHALVFRFDGPASATGENVVEFQCHGGRAIVDALLDALTSLDGLRVAEPGEFTRRAFANGRIDLTEAEGLADLLEAETEAQRRSALLAAEGGLRRQIVIWQERLLGLSAEAERAIDYDEDDGGIDARLSEGCAELAAELQAWLGRPRAERLKQGVRIVIAGPPNAGKSSLLNAIVQEERAIVTDVAGTTRDSIEVPLAIAGVPMVLTDTAGLRRSGDKVEAIGVERAERLIAIADLLLWLGEPGAAPDHPRLLPVHAKADAPERSEVPAGSLAVSLLTGQGLGDLLRWLEAEARSLLPPEDQPALNRRQADCIASASEGLAVAAEAPDLVVIAESLRQARAAFDRLTGRAGVEEMLDALFARFCLGK